VWRAQIVVLSADGVGTNAIMRETGKSKTCVWRGQERFASEGFEGLLRDKTRPSRIAKLDPSIAERVVALTMEAPPGEAKVVESLKGRGVSLCLLDLGGDISGNGMSKLFLTIAAAFAEAERDRIRERVSQSKADQKARGRYLGGIVPFGFRRGESGELVAHEAEQEAIREMAALRAEGRPLRAIADAMRVKGVRISHEGVKGVLKQSGGLVADVVSVSRATGRRTRGG
jgi:hypothetical protein